MLEMKRFSLLRLPIAAFLLATARVGNTTSIAPVKIEDLFAQADQVALVEVLSGDAEHYPIAVYKAVVENAYKGTIAGRTIYFGPFVGTRIGSKYLLFLKRGKPVAASKAGDAPYGDIQSVSRIMYDGYSSLPVSYECVFDGKEISAQCDDAIQLNPEQIVLPDTVRTFPEGDASAVTNYRKWVRMRDLLMMVQTISSQIKPDQSQQ
jgi:hypothetical protein